MIFTKFYNFINEENIFNYYNLIDLTSLKILSNDDIKKLCDTAEKYNVKSISVLPEYVSLSSSFLDDYDINVISTIDFPKGELSTPEKIKEIEKSLINGADEIDSTLNYSLIKNDKWDDIESEIRKLTECVHKEGKIIKFIIEIGILNFHKLEKICNICVKSSVDYIMTSTGKLENDSNFEDKLEKVKFMRKIIPNDTNIKFSGGIRTLKQIKEILPYCDRIGTSVIPAI